MVIEQADPGGVSCTNLSVSVTLSVVIQVEPGLLRVEGDRTVDIAYGNGNEFELPVHRSALPACS
jgi:hypothetical protein